MKRSLMLAFVAVAICFASCKIDRQDKLIGYWKQVPFSDPDSVRTLTYWTFYDGDVLELLTVSNPSLNADDTSANQTSQPSDTISLARYSYNTQGKELNISKQGENGDDYYFVGSDDIRGKYWMDELKKGKRLKMVKREHPDGSKGGVYMRIELVKIKQ